MWQENQVAGGECSFLTCLDKFNPTLPALEEMKVSVFLALHLYVPGGCKSAVTEDLPLELECVEHSRQHVCNSFPVIDFHLKPQQLVRSTSQCVDRICLGQLQEVASISGRSNKKSGLLRIASSHMHTLRLPC